jgi:RNA polymerase sigma-70 factor (ECF subfamily)
VADAGGSADDDRSVVERIAMGDEVAFAAAYDRHAALLFGSVVRFVGDREAAAEVVQDAFLALWRRAHQYDAASGSLVSWLLGIARNRAIDRFRAESRRPTRGAISLSETFVGGELDTDLPGSALDPTAVVELRWRQSVVRSLVADLADAERDVLLLAYGRGLSQTEIAERTGMPLGTVKSRTRRALAHLRDRLAAVPGLVEGIGASHIAAGAREETQR